jgi:hypothetical protein
MKKIIKHYPMTDRLIVRRGYNLFDLIWSIAVYALTGAEPIEVTLDNDFVIGHPNQIKKVQYFSFFSVIDLSEKFQKMVFFK